MYKQLTYLQAFEDYPILRELLSVDFKYNKDFTSTTRIYFTDKCKTEYKDIYEQNLRAWEYVNLLIDKAKENK